MRPYNYTVTRPRRAGCTTCGKKGYVSLGSAGDDGKCGDENDANEDYEDDDDDADVGASRHLRQGDGDGKVRGNVFEPHADI